MSEPIPFTPCNGRILVRQLPYKPSKIIEAAGVIDKAVENEGVVVALSPCRMAYKLKRDARGRVVGREPTGVTFPHEVKIGDRVIFPGTYQDQDVMFFNGEKHRCLEPWDIQGILHKEQVELPGESVRVLDLIK